MDANTLSYTSNPNNNGFILSSPIGKVNYNLNEFQCYKLLFEIIDLDDDGRISFKDTNHILSRTKISRKIVLRAWGTISKNKNDDIVLEQWIVLLKILAYIQNNNNETTDLEIMLRTNSILQFYLLSYVSPVDINTKRNSSSLDIDVTGWKDIGEGLQKYVVYQIRYVTSLLCFSKLEWEVTRRYSDFKFLSDRLLRYEGSLIPPLPPKQMINSLYQDLPVQRSQELSLFLKNIARHPVLFGVLEFRIFLEASQQGFESFKQLIRLLETIETNQDNNMNNNLNSNSDNNSTKSSSNSMTIAGTAAVGYAWNMFTSVNKMIGTQLSMLQSSSSSSTSLSTTSSSNNNNSLKFISDEVLESRYDYLINVLQSLNLATTKMGIVIDLDHKRYHELSRIGFYLKQAGDLDGNKTFDRVVLTTAKTIDYLLLDIPHSLDLQSLEIYFHLQNISRFQSILESNKILRNNLLTNKTNEEINLNKLRESYNNSRLQNGGIDNNLSNKTKAKIKVNEENLTKIEKKLNDVNKVTKRDLEWLNQVTRFELQGRIFGFVQMRIAACQKEGELWERLQSELNNESSIPLFHYEEEEEEEEGAHSGDRKSVV